MRFSYPIENKSAVDLYKMNRQGPGGFYPIGVNNSYHGGMHFDGDHPVVAIADGTLVAYRICKKSIEEISNGKIYHYSNNFVLIRHEYESPKGQRVIFYSHYMHLCPWDEYSEQQKKRRPGIFGKSGFKVTASSLNVRSSMDKSNDSNIIASAKLSKDAEVEATAVNDTWAKKDGVAEYFVYKGLTEPIIIAQDPQFDSIVAANASVKTGALIGYTGPFEDYGIPQNYRCVHVEVFGSDDVEPFVRNTKKDGANKPSVILFTKETTLKKRGKKYPDQTTLPKRTIKAHTNVRVIDKISDPLWRQVREVSLIRSVQYAWLDYHDDKTIKGDEHYTVKTANLANVSVAFDNLEITSSSQFKLVAKDGETKRKIKYTIPEDDAEEYWVKLSDLGKIENDVATLAVDIASCYSVNPETSVFNDDAGSVAADTTIKIDGIERALDADKKVWYKIANNSIEGWVSEDSPDIKKLSAFDWPGFKIAKEAGDSAYDSVIDFENLAPFFKKIIDEINIDSDKSTISAEELKNAFKNESISKRLSRLICFHQSEWWTDSEMAYWSEVFKKLGTKYADILKARFKNLFWWDEVSRNLKDFCPTPNIYHWNPVAFVENMQEMNKEPEWIVIARGEIGQKEISGSKHNNRILEYHNTTALPTNAQTDEIAWCSSFVNWCFKQAGYVGTNSAWAKDWLKWGKLLMKPAYGAVAVIDNGKDEDGKDKGGHVGFIVGKTPKGKILILGGNQGKKGQGSVNETPFGTGSVAGYVLPKDYEFVNYDLEIRDSSENEGTYETTR